MIVGTEWLVEANGCDPECLRDLSGLQELCALVLNDLGLKVVGEGIWHQFPWPAGVTGLYLLTESHLAVHTYPEYRLATFNLYCCRERPAWSWAESLARLLDAEDVRVRAVLRGKSGTRMPVVEESRT